MRTVAYSEILRATAALAGFPWEQVGATEFAIFRTFHDRRLQAAWEIEQWPDICPTEQRTFRAAYASGTTYAATVEVYWPLTGRYYQALQQTTGNDPTDASGTTNTAHWADSAASYSAQAFDPTVAIVQGMQVSYANTGLCYQAFTNAGAGTLPTNTAVWGVLTPLVRSIDYEQPGQTVIGEFFTITNKNPQLTTRLEEYRFTVTADGVYLTLVPPTLAGAVWVQFRTRRPELTGDLLDPNQAYNSGRQVYFEMSTGAGNFYTANQNTAAGETPESNPDEWDLVEIPYIFGGYLKQAGFADWLTSDGQEDKAGTNEAMAEQFLELEADKLHRQQGQVKRLKMY